jgi:tetratricopeptide (TPR) repeat protein
MEGAAAGRLTAAEREAYARGRRGFARGDLDTALDAFETLLAGGRSFADVHYMMAVCLERRGDVEGAEQRLGEALRLNPDYAEALLAQAALAERAGDFERARELAERARLAGARDHGPLDAVTRGKLANLQAELADALAEVGEWRDAIEAYRRALDRCPAFHDIRHRLGVALREAGLPHQALVEFRRVLRGNPRFLDAAVQLGLTLYTLGRPEEARRQWSEVLERDPSRDDARMYLRMVRRGR